MCHPVSAVKTTLRLVLSLSLVLAVAVACSASGGSNKNNGSGGSAASGGSGGSGASAGTGGGVSLDGGAGDANAPPAVAHLKGKVYSPQGVLPISGALVYLTGSAPAPFPDHVFCDRCVKLQKGTPYTFSNADGSFDLGAYSTGKFQLVVEKGQFRRVRAINVTKGTVNVPKDDSTLPKKTDLSVHDEIPKMAVLQGQWDAIEVSLAKFGLGQLQPGPFNLGVQVKPGTASFDIIKDSRQAFLSDYSRLSQYHIVFLPCSGSDGTTCNDFTSGDSTVQQNIQKFVAAGGKLYVTDYSYDYVRQPFPGYLDWAQETSAIGSACLSSEYDANATVMDPDMKAWLSAAGVNVNSFQVKQSWTVVDKVNPVQTTDLDGNPVTVTPKVWVQGAVPGYGDKPTTVSFPRSCGRVLFSTYHTEAGNASVSSPLLPQEVALMYVLLEVGVCIEPPIPA